MKPVLIQHIIRQLKKSKPKQFIEEDTSKKTNTWATMFVLLLALIILIVAIE